ncbi:MAG: endonuclease domain-containing protein [Alphaproteobacteria bacterium]|nr:endonuclease domain-containing protein [Alphaproteobacteria bacterium]
MKYLARHFRKNPTIAEKRLWLELRKLRAEGYHFRRQAPLEGFIVDFACLSQKLIIEVDGTQHFTADGRVADANRDAHLRWRGHLVLRFTNSEIKDNLPGAMSSVLIALGAISE